jgi:hypothetical protein
MLVNGFGCTYFGKSRNQRIDEAVEGFEVLLGEAYLFDHTIDCG